jgi:RNA polymerase sigma factor (sigma-70 family)
MTGNPFSMLATMPADAPTLAQRDRLVCGHLWLVDTLARLALRRIPRAFDLEDLVSAGRVGLIGAAERYQPELHDWTPFAVFARPAVHGAIMQSVRAVWSDGRGRQALRPLFESLDAAAEPTHDAAHNAEAALHDALDGQRRTATLARAVRALPGATERVIRAVYDEGERGTVSAAARRLGISPSRAYRLHKSGVNALRAQFAACAAA